MMALTIQRRSSILQIWFGVIRCFASSFARLIVRLEDAVASNGTRHGDKRGKLSRLRHTRIQAFGPGIDHTLKRTGASTTASKQYLWGERPQHRDELILRDRDTNGDRTLDERLYATMDYFNGAAIVNPGGEVLERYAYSAFGLRRVMAPDGTAREASLFGWEFGFQGQFRDEETGWYNYGYRFYVPILGRWVNRDPIGERGGVNLYGFVGNNGVNRKDSYGLRPKITVESYDNPSVSHNTYRHFLENGKPARNERGQEITYEKARVKSCNIVFFVRHSNSRLQVIGDPCSAAAVYGCFHPPTHGVERQMHISNITNAVQHSNWMGQQGLVYSTEAGKAIENNWENAINEAKSLCNKKPDCCKSIDISVDCGGLSNLTRLEVGVCNKRENVNCEEL